MIGQIIAHYRIRSEIGSGGMGSVYLAQDESSHREVALKILLREHANDLDMRSRFLHEARAQGMVSHPNVAEFYEVGEVSGQAYIAMEYIPGPTLSEFASTQELHPHDAITLVAKLAQGLQAAHAKGVIHRDLKPANIMLTADGQPKITDFGLARFKGATTITKTGRIIGTARYMSPEQAEGRRVDHRSDLFSLGIILYELICRRVPFSGDNDTAVLYELLTRDPQPLSRYASNVPEELERVIARALKKNPDDRYQTAEEFIADLMAVQERLATGRDITIRAAFGWQRIWKRWTTYAVIAALSVAATLIGRTFYQRQVVEGDVLGLAVLPMRNIGAPEREYFTNGVTDELTTRLSGLSGLRVISRTSAMRYKDSTRSVSEIGRALNVDLIVEGTVRWDSADSGMRMRITPSLIRVRDEQAIWTDTYDRAFADVLLTQAEIAEAIASKVGAQIGRTLSLPEQALPTASVDAYNYYLRGSEYLNRGFDIPDLEIAMAQFAHAIELDSNFAAAHARFSRAHSKYYWFHAETDTARLSIARRAAERALSLSPNLPEAHLALGYCQYWGDRDYPSALEQFVQVRNLEPSNADAHFAIGGILRRMNHFDEAAKSFERAAELDALSSNRAFEVGNTYYHMRRYADADPYFNRAINLAPDQFVAYSRKILNYLHCDGATARARLFLDTALTRFEPARFAIHRHLVARLDRQYDSALTYLSLKSLDSATYYMVVARTYSILGRQAASSAAFDSARLVIEAQLIASPESPDLLADLGVAYAGIGRHDDAVRVAERAVQLRPISADAFNGPYLVETLAEVYVRIGDYDRAISQLALLLSLNNPVSKTSLRFDDTWSPLWKDPAFLRLVE